MYIVHVKYCVCMYINVCVNVIEELEGGVLRGSLSPAIPHTHIQTTQQDGALEVWASTQNPTKTQNFCAYVCGVPANKV
jgi:CO/xanthine dehydrogenase Mo-binding subunit